MKLITSLLILWNIILTIWCFQLYDWQSTNKTHLELLGIEVTKLHQRDENFEEALQVVISFNKQMWFKGER